MFLTDSHRVLPFKKLYPAAAAPLAVATATKPFDDALAARLRSLLPIPTGASNAISLSWLTLAVDVLSRTLSDAAAFGADPSPLLASHLDSGIALLDACNAITAAVDSLLRRRLHLRFALHLLSSSPSTTPRARESIKEWEDYNHSPEPRADLVRKLRPLDLPRGKIPAVWRTIYAVESISCLVATAGLAMLGAAAPDPLRIRAPPDFPWAAAFNEVAAAVSERLPGPVAEIEVAEAAAKSLAAAVDGGEGLSAVVGEAEKVTEELTEGLERLSDAVNGLFRVALGTRNAALQGYRVGPQKCK